MDPRRRAELLATLSPEDLATYQVLKAQLARDLDRSFAASKARLEKSVETAFGDLHTKLDRTIDDLRWKVRSVDGHRWAPAAAASVSSTTRSDAFLPVPRGTVSTIRSPTTSAATSTPPRVPVQVPRDSTSSSVPATPASTSISCSAVIADPTETYALDDSLDPTAAASSAARSSPSATSASRAVASVRAATDTCVPTAAPSDSTSTQADLTLEVSVALDGVFPTAPSPTMGTTTQLLHVLEQVKKLPATCSTNCASNNLGTASSASSTNQGTATRLLPPTTLAFTQELTVQAGLSPSTCSSNSVHEDAIDTDDNYIMEVFMETEGMFLTTPAASGSSISRSLRWFDDRGFHTPMPTKCLTIGTYSLLLLLPSVALDSIDTEMTERQDIYEDSGNFVQKVDKSFVQHVITVCEFSSSQVHQLLHCELPELATTLVCLRILPWDGKCMWLPPDQLYGQNNKCNLLGMSGCFLFTQNSNNRGMIHFLHILLPSTSSTNCSVNRDIILHYSGTWLEKQYRRLTWQYSRCEGVVCAEATQYGLDSFPWYIAWLFVYFPRAPIEFRGRLVPMDMSIILAICPEQLLVLNTSISLSTCYGYFQFKQLQLKYICTRDQWKIAWSSWGSNHFQWHSLLGSKMEIAWLFIKVSLVVAPWPQSNGEKICDLYKFLHCSALLSQSLLNKDCPSEYLLIFHIAETSMRKLVRHILGQGTCYLRVQLKLSCFSTDCVFPCGHDQSNESMVMMRRQSRDIGKRKIIKTIYSQDSAWEWQPVRWSSFFLIPSVMQLISVLDCRHHMQLKHAGDYCTFQVLQPPWPPPMRAGLYNPEAQSTYSLKCNFIAVMEDLFLAVRHFDGSNMFRQQHSEAMLRVHSNCFELVIDGFLQAWYLSCLSGHIIQGAYDLMQWKISWLLAVICHLVIEIGGSLPVSRVELMPCYVHPDETCSFQFLQLNRETPFDWVQSAVQVPWDPGGSAWIRLEGKPNVMKGGLSATSPVLGWIMSRYWALGLSRSYQRDPLHIHRGRPRADGAWTGRRLRPKRRRVCLCSSSSPDPHLPPSSDPLVISKL